MGNAVQEGAQGRGGQKGSGGSDHAPRTQAGGGRRGAKKASKAARRQTARTTSLRLYYGYSYYYLRVSPNPFK